MIRLPPRSTQSRSSAASDVYKRQLYDLTNTFFEGSGKYNSKAHFGHSKEKRTDCPLVTLGLVLDADGFPKRSDIFDGNVSEAGTLEGMITALSTADMLLKPLIVMDAGIGTQKNLDWLKEHGYGYLVVSRKRKIDVPSLLEMVTVRQDTVSYTHLTLP